MRRLLSWIARFLLLSLLLGAVGGYLFANHYYNDEALARRIADGFNKTHRGRLHIGRIHWKPSAVLQLLKDGYDDVEITDLRLYDARGSLVLQVPRAVGPTFINKLPPRDTVLTNMRINWPGLFQVISSRWYPHEPLKV